MYVLNPVWNQVCLSSRKRKHDRLSQMAAKRTHPSESALLQKRFSSEEKDDPMGVHIIYHHCPSYISESHAEISLDRRFMSSDVMILTEKNDDGSSHLVPFSDFHCLIRVMKKRPPKGCLAIYLRRRIVRQRSLITLLWSLNDAWGVFSIVIKLHGLRIAILHVDRPDWSYYHVSEALMYCLPPDPETGEQPHTILFSNMGADKESSGEKRLRQEFINFYDLHLRSPLGQKGTVVFSVKPLLQYEEYQTEKDFSKNSFPLYIQTSP